MLNFIDKSVNLFLRQREHRSIDRSRISTYQICCSIIQLSNFVQINSIHRFGAKIQIHTYKLGLIFKRPLVAFLSILQTTFVKADKAIEQCNGKKILPFYQKQKIESFQSQIIKI